MSLLPEADDDDLQDAAHHDLPLRLLRPSPVQTDLALIAHSNGDLVLKKPHGQDAASGLTLDNMEDMIVSLREASSDTRNSKRLRDAARLKKQRENRAKLKLAAAARPADE